MIMKSRMQGMLYIVCLMHEVHFDLVLSLWQCSVYTYPQLYRGPWILQVNGVKVMVWRSIQTKHKSCILDILERCSTRLPSNTMEFPASTQTEHRAAI